MNPIQNGACLVIGPLVLQPQICAGDDDCSEMEDGCENDQRPRHAKRKRSRSKRRRSTKTTEKTVEVTAHEEVRVKLEQPEGTELFDFVQGGYSIDIVGIPKPDPNHLWINEKCH